MFRLGWFIGPVGIIGVIVFFVIWHKMRKEGMTLHAKDRRALRVFLSKEDVVSQLFFAFSLFFLTATLFAFNRELDHPLSDVALTLISSLIALGVSYAFRVLVAFPFALAGLVTWWVIKGGEWVSQKDIQGMALFTSLVLLAFIFYLLGHIHRKWDTVKRFSAFYFVGGAAFITISLFVFSSRYGLVGFEELLKGNPFWHSWQITLALFVLAVSLAGALLYTWKKKMLSGAEMGGIILLSLLFLAMLFFPDQTLFDSRSHSSLTFSLSGILWAILFNLLIFTELAGMIYEGYKRREVWLINLGTFLLIPFILIKYIDQFFSLLQKSLFFMGAGVLFLVVGFLMERSRRYLIATVEGQKEKI